MASTAARSHSSAILPTAADCFPPARSCLTHTELSSLPIQSGSITNAGNRVSPSASSVRQYSRSSPFLTTPMVQPIIMQFSDCRRMQQTWRSSAKDACAPPYRHFPAQAAELAKDPLSEPIRPLVVAYQIPCIA